MTDLARFAETPRHALVAQCDGHADGSLHIRLLTPEQLNDALRDDLADARRERDRYRTMYLAMLDQLALVATAPERYDQMQRELRKEREEFIAAELRADTGVVWTAAQEMGEQE